MSDVALRAQRRYLLQDYDKQTAANSGAGSSDYSDAGPPNWNRASWEAFKAQYGFYPYGNQGGGFVSPSTYDGAPDWVYQLMGLRRPPVTVAP